MEDKSGVGRNAISLPKGGGAAEASLFQFEVDQAHGSGTFAIPIMAPPGRGELNPDLALTYSTKVGFGPAGLGWRLNTSRIERRLDTGVPTYDDAQDVFTYDGEELLQVGASEFRPRVEQQFRNIQKVGDHWQVRDRNGRLYKLGETAGARMYNPALANEVQAWLINRIEDLNGNVIQYNYRRDGRIISPGSGLAFEAGQLYLDSIQYNPHNGGWLHRIELSYDNDDPAGPARGDAMLSYRAGFPLYTAWRLRQIAVYADVPGEFSGLIRAYDLTYTLDPDTQLALLATVTMTGSDDSGNTLSHPPLTFGYTQLNVGTPEVEILAGAPQVDFAGGEYELVDLTSNALPDIIGTSPGNHTFWLNNRWRLPSSVAPGERDFAPGTAMLGSPTLTLTQPATHLADLRGRVAADLLSDTALLDSPSYHLTHADVMARNINWGAATTFATPPPFNFSDGRSRVVDLTGRGRMDVLRADGALHHWVNQESGSYGLGVK